MTATAPKDIDMRTLVQSRMQEITSLTKKLKSDKRFGKLASQQVPIHMRRRAVAHDVRRLPARLRMKYKREKDSSGGNIAAGKRPSRKFRRRPSNLLEEYNRRQNKHFWLETHIWHAKRFHMSDKWGYKIAQFPNDKCWRACYRATKSSCLMFDISYMNTIQIKGPQHVILKQLAQLTRQETGFVFTKTEHVEKKAIIYLPAQEQLIAEVSYLWLEETDGASKVWLTCHPAFVKHLWKALTLAFNLPIADNDEVVNVLNGKDDMNGEDKENVNASAEPPAKKLKIDEPKHNSITEESKEGDDQDINKKEGRNDKAKKDVEKEKLAPRNVPIERAPKYVGDDGVEITDLQGVINRFRLVGKENFEILKKVCVPASVTDCNVEEESFKEDLHWWSKYYSDQQTVITNKTQNSDFEKNKVFQNLALTVRDPRLLLPIKKYMKPKAIKSTKDNKTKKMGEDLKDEEKSDNVSDKMEECRDKIEAKPFSSAPFFDEKIRDAVTLSKAADLVINKKRSERPIPGLSINLGNDESRVPIVILPDTNNSHLDLLIPAGWGMPFWMCLVFNGCRVGADRELQHLSLEQGEPPLLHRYPESATGGEAMAQLKQDMSKQHFLYPPNNRVNFAKLGIVSPFCPPWNILLQDWATEDGLQEGRPTISEIKVLRERKILDQLKSGSSDVKYSDVLVPVKLKIVAKGKLSHNTLICLPTREDIGEITDCQDFEGPVEPLQKDQAEKQRKETQQHHKVMKKRLKRRWKKLKDKKVLMQCQSSALGKELDKEKMQNISDGMTTLKKMRNEENAQFGANTEQLWIGDFERVRHSCRRQIVGYVTVGDNSLRLGCHVGYGFVALKGLKKLMELDEKGRNLVLTRETKTLQYRFSRFEIL